MHQRVKGKRGTLVKPNKKRLILDVISKNKSKPQSTKASEVRPSRRQNLGSEFSAQTHITPDVQICKSTLHAYAVLGCLRPQRCFGGLKSLQKHRRRQHLNTVNKMRPMVFEHVSNLLQMTMETKFSSMLPALNPRHERIHSLNAWIP